MFKDSVIFIFFKTRLLRGDLNWKLNTGTAHLFFLQDDFLLQHFDGVEFIVCSELGEQDLHEGLFVSGLFGKHSLRHHHCSQDITSNPSGNNAPNTDMWSVETDDTGKYEKCVDTKKKKKKMCHHPTASKHIVNIEIQEGNH